MLLMGRHRGHTDIGTVNEAEEVKESYSWNNIQIDLHAKSSLGLGIECNQRDSMSSIH